MTPRFARLSPRLLEITFLVAQGLTTKAIQQRTGLSRSTIECYIRTAADRIGVAGAPRSVLTRWYWQHHG